VPHFYNEDDSSIDISLKMCSWNIKGLKKYYEYISFQLYCSSFDILSFCEILGVSNDEFENILPGYTSFKFCRRKKNTAVYGSGGVTVFVKDCLFKRGSIKRVFDNITECVMLYN
jgi:exonuclease III